MMLLHSRISKKELSDEERFDFIAGNVRKLVLRMDEVHPSTDNDSHYIFLIWVDPAKHDEALTQIKANIKNPDLDRDWTFRILQDTGEGLIIVSTWL